MTASLPSHAISASASAPVPAPRRSWDEADIGSGEKTPGQHDTDELIRQIPPLPDTADKAPSDPPTPTGPGHVPATSSSTR